MRSLKMSNTRQYRYLHKGDNEWLYDPNNADAEGWQEAWEDLKKEVPHQIEFTEDMFINSEYGEMPEWINVTINDSGVLPFKMARGVMSAIDGVRGIVFHTHFDVELSEEWGGWGSCHLELGNTSGAYLTIRAKHSSDELELNITEQFNQAIGEEA
jgi:hypothetical protein